MLRNAQGSGYKTMNHRIAFYVAKISHPFPEQFGAMIFSWPTVNVKPYYSTVGPDKYSGRPAVRSSNETVNQLEIDTKKASEFISWIILNFSASSIDLDGSQALIRDL